MGIFSYFLSVMNNAAMNFCVTVCFLGHMFSIFSDIPRSGIIESYGNSVFKFLRIKTVFQRNCTVLHSHQQEMRVLVFSYSCQHLLFFICCCCILFMYVMYIKDKEVAQSCSTLQPHGL